MSNDHEIPEENVDAIFWKLYVHEIEAGHSGEEVLSGLEHDEALNRVSALFQQSLMKPYSEQSPAEQEAYHRIASIYRATFDES